MPFAGRGKTNFLLKENSFTGSHLHIKCFWRGKINFPFEEFHSPDSPLTLTEINFRPKRNMPFQLFLSKKFPSNINYKITITYPPKDKCLSSHREKKRKKEKNFSKEATEEKDRQLKV